MYERWEDAECLDAAGAAAKDCEDEVGRILMENYEKCRYVKSVGALAVYVTSGCPRAMMIRSNAFTDSSSPLNIAHRCFRRIAPLLIDHDALRISFGLDVAIHHPVHPESKR